MAADLPSTDVICGEITSERLDGELLRKLRELSISIFEPDTPEENLPLACQLSTWEERIQLPGSIVFYASNPLQQPVGLCFVVVRTMPEVGYELPHIFIACVDPASRGLGIFPSLTEKVRKHATKLGYDEITICTYPQRFTKMYRILTQHGWEEVCWLEKDVKVMMKLHV